MKRNISKLINKIENLKKIRAVYIVLLISFIIFLLILMNYFYISTLRHVEVLYARYTKERIIDMKKSFLKDSVNNIIENIKLVQMETRTLNSRRTAITNRTLIEYYESNKENFLQKTIDYFDMEDTKEVFTVVILDRSTGEVLYDKNLNYMKNIQNGYDYIKKLKELTFVYNENIFENYFIFYGVTEDYIKCATTESIRKRIHDDSFENDAYIWINEIVNYEGGDNYAIRLIHQNAIDTEGSYLSTSMQDIKGKYPYLTELNGIKENGELYFTYYFKKKLSDNIGEKLTYAKLYEEYDWIVAMGVYFDEIQPYIDEIQKDGDKAISNLVKSISITSIILILFGIIIVLVLEHWYYNNSNKELIEELNIDTLTKAFNRRAGINKLEEVFYLFKRYDKTCAIIIFDIDDFKKVNDTFGHDIGDKVLIKLVEIINNSTRNTDYLYRWGGEEFLLICEELDKENLYYFTDKILNQVEKYQFEVNNEIFNISISIGASYFLEEDEDFISAVNRADMSLYQSKREGKNKANLYI